MAVDEFGREIPGRRGAGGDRSPSPGYGSPSRGGGGSGSAPQDGGPSNLYEALPTSRYGRSSDDRGGGGSSRKRRHRSESPPPYSRKDSGPRDGGSGRKSSSKQKPHPSTLYADEPMLCQFLWKEANPDKSAPIEDDDNIKEGDAEYNEYRQGYCLNYIRTFFNEHMDDSWYRSKYSPLDAHRAALQELERSTREASQMVSELEESLAKKEKQQQSNISAAASSSAGSTSKCSFVMNARLGGGVKQAYSSSTPSKHGGASNHVPPAHLLSLADQVMPIHEVPPHVTDEQLTIALMSHCTSPSAAAASRDSLVRIYSGSPTYSGDLNRTAYFFAPEEIRKDIITQLNNLDRGGGAPSGEPTGSTSHVPRKEETFIPKVLELIIECSDAYGRMEIDADGKGGAPEDEGGVPPRKAHVWVSTQPLSAVIQVLSAAVSSRKRIRRDAHYALTLAEALDQKRNIPNETRLSQLLAKASLPLMTTIEEDASALRSGVKTEDSEGGSSNEPQLEDVEDALDVSIAYLRRVHLFSFYNGCSIAPNVGDVLSHNHATSTIHLRLSNADDILREKEEKATDAAMGPPAGTAATESIETKVEGEAAESSEPAAAPATVTNTVDLLEQRLNDAIEKALQELEPWYKNHPPARSVVVDAETDAQAQELLEAESQVEDVWIQDHAFIDEDGRARCSFHFCRKLFKDSKFLKKHLLKKHSEFLRAEIAKCHDSYMMKAWDTEEKRPVPPVLVDCGRAFGLVPSPVLGGAAPTAADPEPELWRRQEERRKQEEEEQQMRRERFSHHHNSRDNDPYRNDPSGGLDSALSEPRPSRQEDMGSKPGRHGGFVDVDDMKEEKVEMSFDTVEVPVQPPKKKRKKKKLL